MRPIPFAAVLLVSCAAIDSGSASGNETRAVVASVPHSDEWTPSAAYQWLDIMLEAAARDVDAIGARPTILARQMAINCTAVFDAWAAYDGKAVGTMYGAELRRPAAERTQANKEKAIAYAMYRTCLDMYPMHAEYLSVEMKRMGFDPNDASMDRATPQGVGNLCAKALLDFRHYDGSNQLGNEVGSNGKPYSDYT